MTSARQSSKTLRLANRDIGEGEPTFVLAEIASAHQGSAEEAIALSRLAFEAGADGVKFQLFRADALIAPNDPRYDTFRRIQLSLDEWHRVLEYAEHIELPLFADIFDKPSLDLAEEHDFAGYKIHSTDLENPGLIRAIAETGKPLLLGTGGVSPSSLAQAIIWVQEIAGTRWMPMHGVQNFPTRLEDTGLRALGELKQRYARPVGFLDHVDGGSPEAVHLPALAVVAGADLVEKHITRDRSAEGFDYQSSLEKETFSRMIREIRQAELALGDANFSATDEAPGDAADRYHRLMRRASLAARDLGAGHRLSRDDVVFLRNESGLPPSDIERHFGKRLRGAVDAFEPLNEEHLE